MAPNFKRRGRLHPRPKKPVRILYDSKEFEVVLGRTPDAGSRSRVTIRGRSPKGDEISFFLDRAHALIVRDALLQGFPIPEEPYWTVPYTEAAPEYDEMVVVVRAPSKKLAILRAQAHIRATFYKSNLIKIHLDGTKKISLASVFEVDAQMVPEE